MKNVVKKALCIATSSAMAVSVATWSGSAVNKVTPKASSPVTLNWYLYVDKTQSDLTAVQNALNNYLVKKINVKVNIHEMDCGTYGKKMPIIINAGEDYDICQAANWGIVNYASTAATGAFWNLSDSVLKKDAPQAYKAIPKLLWTSSKLKGKCYGVPTNKESGIQYDLMINDTLAKKYKVNYSKLKSWKDLGPILKDAKSKLPKTVIPMDPVYIWGTANAYSVSAGPQAGYVAIQGKDSPYNNIKKNTVFDVYETPFFKSYCNTVNSWYKAGYFPSNVQTYSDDQRNLDDKANKLFAWIICYAPGYDLTYSKAVGHTEKAVAITPNVSTGASDFQCISAHSTHKDAALKFLNLVNTDVTVGNYLRHGIKGRNYVLKNNRVHALNTNLYGTDIGWQYGSVFNQTWSDATATNIVNQYKAYNDNAVTNPLLGYSFDDSNVKNQIAAISSIQTQYHDPLVNGFGDPATLLPQYISALKANGLSDLMKEEQTQVTKFVNSNK